MNEQLQFIESIKKIAELGKMNHGKLTRQQVADALPDFSLNEEQWKVMGEFLFHRQVLLEGYTPEKEQVQKPPYELSQEEQNFKKFYEEDLRALPKLTENELENKLQQAIKGGEELVGLYNYTLPILYEIAQEYVDGREQLGDLVQEANLKCFMMLEESSFLAGRPILDSIKEQVRFCLNAYIAEGEDETKENNKIADKLNQLVEAVEVLKEQNAIYTIQDLSEFLDIGIEEIEKLLRVAGESTNEEDEKSQ